jgi:hypothetical protein
MSLVALVLLGGSVFTLTVSKEQHDLLKAKLSDTLATTYENIVTERRNHFLQGLLLGFVLAAGYQYYLSQSMSLETRFHKSMRFFAIMLVTAIAYYSLMPKTDYMLKHNLTPEQTKAWFEMYQTMRGQYMIGMLLGAFAAIPLSQAYCEMY